MDFYEIYFTRWLIHLLNNILLLRKIIALMVFKNILCCIPCLAPYVSRIFEVIMSKSGGAYRAKHAFKIHKTWCSATSGFTFLVKWLIVQFAPTPEWFKPHLIILFLVWNVGVLKVLTMGKLIANEDDLICHLDIAMRFPLAKDGLQN